MGGAKAGGVGGVGHASFYRSRYKRDYKRDLLIHRQRFAQIAGEIGVVAAHDARVICRVGHASSVTYQRDLLIHRQRFAQIAGKIRIVAAHDARVIATVGHATSVTYKRDLQA